MRPKSELRAAFFEALALLPETDVDHAVYGQVQGWDSVGHMRLIALLEERFDVMIETDDVIDMSSFDKALEILKRHGVEFEP